MSSRVEIDMPRSKEKPFQMEELRAFLEEVTESGPPVLKPLLPFDSYPDLKGYSPLSVDALRMWFGREKFIELYGFVLVTEECLAALVAQTKGKRVLDVGSGCGFLAFALEEQGVEVTALDMEDPKVGTSSFGFKQVWKLDVVSAFQPEMAHAYDVVILSWPGSGTVAADVARALLPGQILLYMGEWRGGCTAEEGFFELLDGSDWELLEPESRSLNMYHYRFQGLKDRWHVYRRC